MEEYQAVSNLILGWEWYKHNNKYKYKHKYSYKHNYKNIMVAVIWCVAETNTALGLSAGTISSELFTLGENYRHGNNIYIHCW